MKIHPELRINIALKDLFWLIIFLIRAILSVYTLSLFFLWEDFLEMIPQNYITIAKISGIIIFILIWILFAYLVWFFSWLKKQKQESKKLSKTQYIIWSITLFIYFIFEFLIRSTSRNNWFRCFKCIFENESTTNLFRFLLFLLSLIFIIIIILIFFYIYGNKK